MINEKTESSLYELILTNRKVLRCSFLRKLLLITHILFLCMILHAQQGFSGKQIINLLAYGNEPDSLYNGHSYEYYNAQFKNATGMRNAGIVFTSLGIGLFASVPIAATSSFDKAAAFFYASVAALSIGVPLWIAGGVKRKNNRKAMGQIKTKTSLSFRTTHNGVGLVLNF